MATTQRADAVIVGAGHNGLVAACYLARAGKRVVVLEARDVVGGAAISSRLFPGVDARLSKYSYLVSLLPRFIADDLGIALPVARRRVSSYTPDPADPSRGLVVPVDDRAAFDAAMRRLTGSTRDADAWRAFYGRTTALAQRVFPTLTEPLRSREEFHALVGEEDWRDFFERPLGEVLERTFESDVVRGIVLTDGLIGTFASAHDASLHQNICFLYHVIGNGTGDWDVPIGGMGALTGALADRARELGADIRLSAPVTSIDADARGAVVRADGLEIACDHVLANCAPAVLDRLMGREPAPIDDLAGGAQVKVNMLLARLPRLKDASVDPRDAFAGTFHVHESYSQHRGCPPTGERRHPALAPAGGDLLTLPRRPVDSRAGAARRRSPDAHGLRPPCPAPALRRRQRRDARAGPAGGARKPGLRARRADRGVSGPRCQRRPLHRGEHHRRHRGRTWHPDRQHLPHATGLAVRPRRGRGRVMGERDGSAERAPVRLGRPPRWWGLRGPWLHGRPRGGVTFPPQLNTSSRGAEGPAR